MTVAINDQRTVVEIDDNTTEAVIENKITLVEVENTETVLDITEVVNLVQVVDEQVLVEIVESAVSLIIDVDEITVEILSPITDILTIGIQGPQGPPGVSAQDQINSGPFAASITGIVDSVLIALIRSVKWVITVSDNTNSKYATYEVFGRHNGTVAKHSRYGHQGSLKDLIDIDVTVSGVSMEISITNNHSSAVKVSVLRFATEIV